MKKFSILIISLIVFAANCFASELVTDYLDIAKNYKDLGNFAKALEYVNYVLMLEPKNPVALKFKTSILPQEANDDESQTALLLSNQKHLEKLTIIDVPKDNRDNAAYSSDHFNNQGKKFYAAKDYDNALHSFFKAVTVNPQNYIAFNNLAMSYWMKNDLDNAEKYFMKAFSVNKNYTQSLLNLALLYKQKGDLDKYFVYLNKAIKANPDNYWAYYLLGDYFSSEDKPVSAMNAYLECIKINQNFAPPYLALAVNYFKTDKNKLSIAALNHYLTLCPESDFAYSMLAKNNQLLGEYKIAKTNIERALEMNNSNQYRYELAKIEFNMKQYDSAMVNFQILLPEFDFPEIYNYIGLCNYELGNFNIAMTYLNKAIVLDAHRPIFYYNLAKCYEKLGDKRNYAKYMNTALQINPISYQDFIDLSFIYYNNANQSVALNTLVRGVNSNPDCKPIYMALLNFYALIGDKANYKELKDEIDERFNSDEKKKRAKLFK